MDKKEHAKEVYEKLLGYVEKFEMRNTVKVKHNNCGMICGMVTLRNGMRRKVSVHLRALIIC